MHDSFRDFDISIEIDKTKKDIMQTFTLKIDSGKGLIVNGSGIIRSLKILTISNKEN